MASDLYSYEPLDPSPGTIRLLEVLTPQPDNVIRCKLIAGKINSSDFKALSYVWGPATTTFSISLNGKLWKVRHSLYMFLRKAQHDYAHQLIWIDALCINQDDVLERNQQVSQMCRLYGSASEVLVWLEDEITRPEFFAKLSEDGSWQGRQNENRADEADYGCLSDGGEGKQLQKWSGWYDPDEDEEAIPPILDDIDELEPWSNADHEASMQLFEEIGSHAYWKRMWVVQEFCLAKQIVVVSSQIALPFAQFEKAFLLTNPDRFESSVSNQLIGDLVFWRQGNYQAVTDESRLLYPEDLFGLLRRFGKRNCTDLRDRVFALVGMSHEADHFKIDYAQNVQQVFISTLTSLRSSRFHAAILLFELLEIPISGISTANLPPAAFSYPIAGGYLVLNGTGPRSRFHQLWLCECYHCNSLLAQEFHSNGQVILQRTSQKSVWLLYALKPIGQSTNLDMTLHFRLIACASPLDTYGRKLCAFIPESPLLKLFYESELTLTKEKGAVPIIHLNERSIFAYAFCASNSSESDAFEHKTMQVPPKPDLELDQGPVGTVFSEWDWDCSRSN